MKKYIIIPSVFILSFFILNINSVYALRPVGCSETSNYSITTGQSCSVGEGSYSSTYLPSCSSFSGYSLIIGGSCTVLVNTNIVFNFKAKDPDGGNLSWSINWGDNQGLLKTCPSFYPNTAFSSSHAWATTGTYNVKLGVSNCKEGGDATASFDIVVKNSVTTPTPVPVPVPVPVPTPTPIPNPVSTPTSDATGLNGQFVSPFSILLKWNAIHTPGYRGGYNIYKNGTLWSRTRTDLVNAKDYYPTMVYDTQVRCPSTQRYQIEQFEYYGEYWKIIPSGIFSGVATVVGSSCLEQTISVISPNGGETYKTGETVNIKWETKAFGEAGGSIALSVYKYLPDRANSYYGVSPAFGKTVNNDIVNGIAQDTGSFQWTIPSTFTPGNYIVFVAGGNSIRDTSDTSFSIIK